MAAKIKKGDRVVVLAGRDKGRSGEVVQVRPKEARAVEAALRAIPQVCVLQSVSGTFDMIAQIVAESTSEMDGLVDAIGALDGVERTMSSIVLSTKFDR